ncbi:GNAT family N-acetyltransferase [Flavobacterium qiangtangense]|uniref:GNAT family N-acetyltransferase n=1 Tax=Flavobacterium qiangtangense TaxID=1442595 RepID=A0ABW1PL41_9FLAO
MINVRLIKTSDRLYPLEQELRNKILLRPVGIPDHAWEMHDEKSWHFVAVEAGQVLGCVVLVPLDGPEMKGQLIQMAVDGTQQGKGVGKLLVKELFAFCELEGIHEVVCHARDSAVPFYRSLGFEAYGEPFEEVGIKHMHMRIVL